MVYFINNSLLPGLRISLEVLLVLLEYLYRTDFIDNNVHMRIYKYRLTQPTTV